MKIQNTPFRKTCQFIFQKNLTVKFYFTCLTTYYNKVQSTYKYRVLQTPYAHLHPTSEILPCSDLRSSASFFSARPPEMHSALIGRASTNHIFASVCDARCGVQIYYTLGKNAAGPLIFFCTRMRFTTSVLWPARLDHACTFRVCHSLY